MYKQIKQGNLLLIKVSELPVESMALSLRSERQIILGYSAHCGQAHSVNSDYAVMFSADPSFASEQIYLKVYASTELTHRELGSIELAPGVYKVLRDSRESNAPHQNVDCYGAIEPPPD